MKRTKLFGIAIATGASFAAWAQPPGFRATPLPDGEGKAQVEAACVACHQTNMIQGSVGYTEEGWRYLTSKMIALQEPMRSTITKYLATHFPPMNERAPKLVPGPAHITFKEWTAPTLKCFEGPVSGRWHGPSPIGSLHRCRQLTRLKAKGTNREPPGHICVSIEH